MAKSNSGSQIFPSVSALTLTSEDGFICLRQHGAGSDQLDLIEIPRVFLPAVIRALFDAMEPGEQKDALASALAPEFQ